MMRYLSRSLLLVVCVAWLLFYVDAGFAEEVVVKPADSERIRKATLLAERVLDRAGDASGAVKIFQEAGIAALLQEKPPGFPLAVYIQALLGYADALFLFPDRYTEAEPVLNLALRYQSDLDPAYLLLGDIYQKRYLTGHSAEHAARAKQYYLQYTTVLKARQMQAVLPERVLNTVYPMQSAGVCVFVKQLLAAEQEQDLRSFFRAETAPQTMSRDATGKLSGGEPSLTFTEFANADAAPVYRSRVDIDNDGHDELRYWKTVQATGCMRNLFYKVSKDDAHGRSFMTNPLLDNFFAGDRVCEGGDLQFIRFRNVTYFLEKSQWVGSPAKYNLYRLGSEGKSQDLCSLDIRAAVPLDVQPDCSAPVCKRLLAVAGDVIAAQGDHGVERRVGSDVVWQFDDTVLQDAVLSKYAKSPHRYRVDLDNDGKDELIVRLWEKDAAGKSIFSYRLFRQVDEIWKLLLWPEELSSEDQLQEDVWFFVEVYEGRNYIVTYQALLKTQDDRSFMEYEMRIYLYENGKLSRVGLVEIKDPKVETSAAH